MDESIPEEILCPICFEIPLKEIFQCSNGHIVCSICAKDLRECPQCRVPFENNKIRNRVLETLLDTMKFDCSNKLLGCNAKVTRNDVSSHLESCYFRSISISFCKSLGFSCGFQLNPKSLQEGLKHLQEQHGFIVSQEPEVDIHLDGIVDISQNQKSLWTPVILDLESTHDSTLLLLVLFNEGDKAVSIICIQLNDKEGISAAPDEILISVHAKSVEPKEAPDLKFSTAAVCIKQAINAIKYPQFSFKLNYLVNQYAKDSALVVRCSVKKQNTAEQEERIAPSLILLNSSYEETAPENYPTAPPPSPPPRVRPNVPIPPSDPPDKRRQRRRAPPLPPRNLGHEIPPTFRHHHHHNIHHNINPQATAASTSAAVSRLTHKSKIFTFKNVCNACGNLPTGVVFKCLQCADYDLCQSCVEAGEHERHIFAIILNKKQYREMSKSISDSKKKKQPFLSNPLVLNDSESSGEISANGICCECPQRISKLCLQCRPAFGFCDNCFERNSEYHFKDHFFAVVNTERKLRLVLQNLPDRGK